jgi:hypothetical protein
MFWLMMVQFMALGGWGLVASGSQTGEYPKK